MVVSCWIYFSQEPKQLWYTVYKSMYNEDELLRGNFTKNK
jgi:hypothetical protein